MTDNKLQYLLQSRKFWAMVIVVFLILGSAFIPNFPLDKDATTKIVATAVAYIIGTAIEDSGRAKAQ